MGCGISRSPIDRLLLETHNGCLVVLDSIATLSLFCDFLSHVAFSEGGGGRKLLWQLWQLGLHQLIGCLSFSGPYIKQYHQDHFDLDDAQDFLLKS